MADKCKGVKNILGAFCNKEIIKEKIIREKVKYE